MTAYLDASALVKLAVEEDESAALQAALSDVTALVSSVVGAVELLRAAGRVGLRPRAEVVLEGVDLIELDGPVRELAGQLDPPELRSLDAIHLASALSLGDDLRALFTYDVRLGTAAQAAGVNVLTPA